MKRVMRSLIPLCVCAALGTAFVSPFAEFRWTSAGAAATRAGDLDADGIVTIGDAVFLLNFLFQGGPAPAACAAEATKETTTIIVVRHAEKEIGVDPGLTPLGRERAQRLMDVLKETRPNLLLASTLRRTVETLQPLADLEGQSIEQFLEVKETLARLEKVPPGGTAIVAHHSFTIFAILRGLGVDDGSLKGINIGAFDHLFVVTRSPASAPKLLRLRYASDLNEPPLDPQDKGQDE